MKAEIIKAEDYGLQSEKADELTIGLNSIRLERDLLIKEFEETSSLEITESNIPKFKSLRLRIVKNRTQGINKWHKANKDFFLTGGRFVDAIKNKEVSVNEQMEEKLMSAEKHFENLEKKRLEDLQHSRVLQISEYLEDANERDLYSMDDDVWQSFFETKKSLYLERIEAERKEEEEIQAKIKAEKEEQERIKKENERLKAEVEEREKKSREEAEKRAKVEAEIKAKEETERKKREEKERKERQAYEVKLKAEREAREKIQREEKAKREKLEAELKAKEEAERKEKEEEERLRQVELSKGDSAKVEDLISDLLKLKTKYSFSSSRNMKMYKEVNLLIDKVVNHVKK